MPLKYYISNLRPEAEMLVVFSLGPDLLVAFHSTPYGNPLDPHPPPPYPLQLRGFELDIEVLVVDSFSSEVVNSRGDCLFIVSHMEKN